MKTGPALIEPPCGHGRAADDRKFALRLRVTRLTLGITEPEAAEGYGVTLRTYRKWESGHPTQRALPLVKFAKTYRVSLDWLIDGDGFNLGRHLTSETRTKLAILPVTTAENAALRRELLEAFLARQPVQP